MERKKLRMAQSKVILTIYIFLSVSVLALGYLYYIQQRKDLQNDINNNLKAIAELKTSEIQAWLNERFADANFFAQTTIFIGDLERVFIKSDEKSKNQLSKSIYLIKEQYKYQDVILVDLNGKVLLSSENNFLQLGDKTTKTIEEVRKTGQITFSDFYWCTQHNQIHVDFIIPLTSDSNSSKQLSGYAILRINPDDYLYPIINKWPTSSKTAETLLIRKDGDSVLFINNVRHANNSALKLKIPLTRTNVPAVRGILGLYGLYEGVDYRNKRVLSYTLQVPETNWVLVSKIDTSEAYDPLRKQAWIAGTILLLLLSFLGFALVTIRINDQKMYLKKLLDIEIERKAIVSHFEYLFKYANDIITLLSKDFKIVEANDRALAAYGYSRAEMIGIDGKLLCSDLGRTLVSEYLRLINDKRSAFYEAIDKRKDGSEFPVEVSARLIEIEGNEYYQFIARDITERKQAFKTLETQHAQLKAIINSSNDIIIFSLDKNYCYTTFNKIHREEMKRIWNADIMIGMNFLDCMNIPEIRETAKQSIDRVLNGEVITEIQHQPIPSAYYEANWNPIIQENQIMGATVFIKNISERVQNEEKIRNQLDELKRWQNVTLNREDRNIELKQEVNELLIRVGETIRYPSQAINNLNDKSEIAK